MVNNREVVIVSSDGTSGRGLTAIAEQIRAATGALVLVDHQGRGQLESAPAAVMRQHGWVRIEELERAVAEARQAAAP